MRPAALLIPILSACASAPRAATRDAVAAIAATSAEFSRRYERGDADGMVALYTPDGVALAPGRAAIRGAAPLREYWGAQARTKVLSHVATPDSVVVAGSTAYDWGVYRARFLDGAGAERETVGKYAIVWRETAPGTWRMHVDMWNQGAPAPAGADTVPPRREIVPLVDAHQHLLSAESQALFAGPPAPPPVAALADVGVLLR
ncbi:nuclear transport factor 2 family protein, partial [Roseisolibacter sp. H3M3-2]|uniref:YybH family protein n=1 Tax=Roseisolibacter sp. H3M3-2 TaxID=3031323 RepID=UPI0023DB708A